MSTKEIKALEKNLLEQQRLIRSSKTAAKALLVELGLVKKKEKKVQRVPAVTKRA